jgi:hypothetical protein
LQPNKFTAFTSFIAEKDVNVPEYLQIDTPNPMTD